MLLSWAGLEGCTLSWTELEGCTLSWAGLDGILLYQHALYTLLFSFSGRIIVCAACRN